MNRGIDFVVDIVVSRARDFGFGGDAVRIRLVEFVEHTLQEVLIGLRSIVPIRHGDMLALEINGIDFGCGLGWIVDLDCRARCGGR